MTDLFWPGDNRAGDLMSESAFLAAMVEVENSGSARLSTQAWHRSRAART